MEPLSTVNVIHFLQPMACIEEATRSLVLEATMAIPLQALISARPSMRDGDGEVDGGIGTGTSPMEKRKEKR